MAETNPIKSSDKWMVFLTLILAIWAIVLPVSLESIQWYLIGFLVLTIGIPHGASDLMIWLSFRDHPASKGHIIGFLLVYLTLVGLFVATWFLFPSLALLVFIIISAYHFGQSNFAEYPFKWDQLKPLVYVAWGLSVIAFPIVFDLHAADPVLQVLLGSTESIRPFLNDFGILISSVSLILSLFLFIISVQVNPVDKVWECLKVLILVFLFWAGGLWLSFIWYFTIWHSWGSVLDQLQYFRGSTQRFSQKQLIAGILPISLGALILMLWFMFFSGNLELNSQALAHFFMILAALTLPHMILMDRLYLSLFSMKN